MIANLTPKNAPAVLRALEAKHVHWNRWTLEAMMQVGNACIEPREGYEVLEGRTDVLRKVARGLLRRL